MLSMNTSCVFNLVIGVRSFTEAFLEKGDSRHTNHKSSKNPSNKHTNDSTNAYVCLACNSTCETGKLIEIT